MRVFKYRGGNFERDMNSLEKNFYWSPKFEDLNDPCETLVNTNPFKFQAKAVAKLFGKHKSEQFIEVENAFNNLFDVKKRGIGIYSLSQTYKDELLWAHYANSHKGFCIEYDLDLLINSYRSFEAFSFPVEYKKKPPEYGIGDVNSSKAEIVVQKIAGCKSIRWNYEKEHRIVTGFYGEHPYVPECMMSIYFGLNMDEREKELMKDKLKGRGVQFFQMVLKPNSYEFEAVKVNDLSQEKITYFKEIPSEITGNDPVPYKITSKVYIREIKAMVEIELESKVDEKEIDWLAILLRKDMFRLSKRLFISFRIKGHTDISIYWATATFEESKLETSINGLSIEQERALAEGLRNEKRDVIGQWMDESNNCSMTLLEINNLLFLETHFSNGGKSSKKVISKECKGKKRYDDYEPNIHGEYFEVNNDGVLNYCSENGIFLTLKPFNRE
jgi:hypothetical protein